MKQEHSESEVEIITGDFFTDGKTFVFRLAGTPLSGTGETPTAAFQDLMRVRTSGSTLSQRLKELARDQQGERVRATVIRATMTGLIVLGVAAGALVTASGMAPRVAGAVAWSVTTGFDKWLDRMTPEQEAKLATLLQRVGA
jgi:hypothetical protein